MIDEDKLSQAASKAARAESLLSNELLIEAYDGIEAQLVEAWILSPARDDDGRKRLWDQVQANRKHREFLRSHVNNGKLAAAELKQLAERKRRFGVI